MAWIPGWWVLRQFVPRVLPLILGAYFVVDILTAAGDGLASWPNVIFGIGVGLAGAAGAMLWKHHKGELFPEAEVVADRKDHLSSRFALALGVGMLVVIYALGYWGGVVGGFLLLLGVYRLESFRRRWREVRRIEHDRGEELLRGG